MFVAEALFNFSKSILKQNQSDKESSLAEAHEKIKQENFDEAQNQLKRKRSEDQEKQLEKFASENNKNQKQQEPDKDEVVYLEFQVGDKILVEHAYESGWWYGNVIKKSEKGFFPSNYVKVGAKPPPPKQMKPQRQEQAQQFDPQQPGWIEDQLKNAQEKIEVKALPSSYYQGITGYKMVKIDDKNKNILTGNYVKFDVNTGMAKVPIKDQSPGAKSVRQMGYYFDYHQWNEGRNKNPEAKSKADPTKKKKKKLHLIGMD